MTGYARAWNRTRPRCDVKTDIVMTPLTPTVTPTSWHGHVAVCLGWSNWTRNWRNRMKTKTKTLSGSYWEELKRKLQQLRNCLSCESSLLLRKKSQRTYVISTRMFIELFNLNISCRRNTDHQMLAIVTHTNVTLYCQKLVTGPHFCCWLYGSVFIQILVGSERRVFCAIKCVMAHWPFIITSYFITSYYSFFLIPLLALKSWLTLSSHSI